MNEEEVKQFWLDYTWYFYHERQRRGQAYMNALRAVAPELYEEASGNRKLDCFHDDGKITALAAWLGL